MAEAERKLARGERIDFQTDPSRYRHWRLAVGGEVATLAMDVAEDGGLFEGYQLKLNSYDLGVDIELADALTRLRFEHPGGASCCCARPRQGVLRRRQYPHAGRLSHAHKVNFCKFTNETRNSFEDASEHSGLSTSPRQRHGGGRRLRAGARGRPHHPRR